VATNREIDLPFAQLLKPIFLEIVMAPSYAPDALALLCTKKNLRVLKVDMAKEDAIRKQYVSMNGGMLVQDRDSSTKTVIADQCVTEAKPTEAQLADLDFAWHIVKHVKSNAIVIAKDGMSYGVGAGQMNRVGSAEIALKEAEATLKEEDRDIRKEGLVLASDGFFPFDDCVAIAVEYGITAIVQPGGSIRDEDSIKLCNEKGITMLFTGERHFKH
jgi:phosphoribosylaminoimidazolecarboxamide formyltransferase/IMP cyclohydrolase